MNTENTFQPFPKMARLSRECVITEKIDGTNAQIYIADSVGEENKDVPFLTKVDNTAAGWGCIWIAAGSRNKWLTTEKNHDNYGFARWVTDNAEQLVRLGPGRHFGEWWGAGIQRRYGLTEKRFSLFNAARWQPLDNNRGVLDLMGDLDVVVPCCHVVPVLHRGEFETPRINGILVHLEKTGSVAAPGFPDPEGIVIWHEAARVLFKKTIKDDEQPKSKIIPVDTDLSSVMVGP